MRAENHGTGVDFSRLARDAINVENAASAVAFRVHEDFVGHRIGDERAVSGRECVGYGGEGGVEIRVRHTAAFARAAIMAGTAAVGRFG